MMYAEHIFYDFCVILIVQNVVLFACASCAPESLLLSDGIHFLCNGVCQVSNVSYYNVPLYHMLDITRPFLLVIRPQAEPHTHYTHLLWVRSTSITDLITNLSRRQSLFSR